MEWEDSTTIVDGRVHVGFSEVVATVGISEISVGRATFTVEGDAVTVDVGRIMLVGYASVHLMEVDGKTVRFTVDLSPGVVSADDVERRISWELGIDREQAHCPSDLVAEVGAWITCSADSGDRTFAEVEVTLLEVRDEDVELAAELVSNLRASTARVRMSPAGSGTAITRLVGSPPGVDAR